MQNVGKEQVRVQSLMGAGVDPHVYKATASDIIKLQNADIIFYNGLHLEGRMTDQFKGLSKRGKPVYALTEKLSKDDLLTYMDDMDLADPHVWFDSKLWSQCAQEAADVLAEKDPENAIFYKDNASAYQKELEQLDAWGQKKANELPKAKRILVTSHDAYNYFGKAFDFQVIGIQGLSTVSEAGLADIVSMVDFIREKQIKAIFVETSVSQAAITRVSEDSGAAIGGELFSDSLGAPKEFLKTINGESYDVGTYTGMFKYNMETIVGALK